MRGRMGGLREGEVRGGMGGVREGEVRGWRRGEGMEMRREGR